MTAEPRTHRWRPRPHLTLYTRRDLALHANRLYEAILNTQNDLTSDLQRFQQRPGSLGAALLLARSLERARQPAMILHTPAGHAWVASDEMHVNLAWTTMEEGNLNVSVSKRAPTYDLHHILDLRTNRSGDLAFDLPDILADEPTVLAFLQPPLSQPGPVRPVRQQWGSTVRLSCGHWLLGKPTRTRTCPYCPQDQPG